MKTMPTEPTPEIIEAMKAAQQKGPAYIADESIRHALWVAVYKAALKAAP